MEITLDTGAKVTIPDQFEYSKCKGCGADDIIWATTSTGNLCLLDMILIIKSTFHTFRIVLLLINLERKNNCVLFTN